MKQEDQFRMWEQVVFGSGYGTGELPILKAVKSFFNSLEGDGAYDYMVLERVLGDTVAWLLINAFSKGNMIEWGTSARHGWLTSCGRAVRDFVKDKTAQELYDIVMVDDQDSICHCNGEIKAKGHEFCGKNPMTNEAR